MEANHSSAGSAPRSLPHSSKLWTLFVNSLREKKKEREKKEEEKTSLNPTTVKICCKVNEIKIEPPKLDKQGLEISVRKMREFHSNKSSLRHSALLNEQNQKLLDQEYY